MCGMSSQSLLLFSFFLVLLFTTSVCKTAEVQESSSSPCESIDDYLESIIVNKSSAAGALISFGEEVTILDMSKVWSCFENRNIGVLDEILGPPFIDSKSGYDFSATYTYRLATQTNGKFQATMYVKDSLILDYFVLAYR